MHMEVRLHICGGVNCWGGVSRPIQAPAADLTFPEILHLSKSVVDSVWPEPDESSPHHSILFKIS
jgi:hypothetical protein